MNSDASTERSLLCIPVGGIDEYRVAALLFDRISPIFFQVGARNDEEYEQWDRLRSALQVNDGENARVDLAFRGPTGRTMSIKPHEPHCYLWPPWVADQRSGVLESNPMVQVTNIPAINFRSLTNEQVIAFRQDATSRRKLRRLRAFLHKNYSGQPLSYVEDDLLTRIDDYQAAAKAWGFETVNSTLSVAGDDKILAAACAGLASVVAGMALPQAAAVGMMAVLGSSLVKIGMARWRRVVDQSTNAVSYLVDIIDASRDTQPPGSRVGESEDRAEPRAFLTGDAGEVQTSAHASSDGLSPLAFRAPWYYGERPGELPYCPQCYDAERKSVRLTLEIVNRSAGFRCPGCQNYWGLVAERSLS